MKERMNFGKFLIRLCTPLAHLIFPFKTPVSYTHLDVYKRQGRDGFPEAVEAARRAEAVVLVLGGSSARESDEAGTETGAAVAANLREMNGGEGADYASLTLDGEQRALARACLLYTSRCV